MYSSRSLSLPNYATDVRPNSLIPTFEGMFRRAVARVQEFAATAGQRLENVKGDCQALGVALALIGTPLLFAAAWQATELKHDSGVSAPVVYHSL